MTQSTALSILKLGHTSFLTGAAGAGKSYVLREYITYLKRHGIRYAVTASTGIASTHISGTTIHAWSGIGIKKKLSLQDIDALEEKQNLYKRWNDTQVLIIDEISMLQASFIDMLDTLAKSMRRSEKPFGGMQIIFTGDFFQLPPVIRNTDEAVDIEYVYAFASRAWKVAKPVICYLTEQFRQEDDTLLHLLNAIRKGEIEEDHFSSLEERHLVGGQDIIRLYTHNENVDEINRQAFEKLKGDERVYEMITKGKANVLESLKNNCLAEETLKLKIGAKVICIKNSQDRNYVNGSMGKVIAFDNEGAPIVELTNGKKVTIVADSWKIEEDGKVRAEISQLPIKLAWAITVHKSQGMTLDEAEIDLSRAFTSGQGYVALSRLKSLSGLYLKGFNNQALMIDERVREMDKVFASKSSQAENAVAKYSEAQLLEMHRAFILEKGGSEEELDEDIEDVKVASHAVTQELLNGGDTIEVIAEKRSLSVDTIIGHIEKLIDLKEKVDLKHTLPPKKSLDAIKKAFTTLDTTKLTPVYEQLKGKCSYQDIRIARAYLKSK